MKLRCDCLDYNMVKEILSKYPFTVEPCPCDTKIVMDENNLGIHQFIDDAEGLLISPRRHYSYKGITYAPFGACTVYWNGADRAEYKMCWKKELELRLIHEIAHHFGMPSDDFEKWLDGRKFKRFLYSFGGRDEHSWLCIVIHLSYYTYLFKDFDEKKFNEENDIAGRNFRGDFKWHRNRL